MTDQKPLTDIEVWDAIHECIHALEGKSGETRRGETALRTACETLKLIQMGHLADMDRENERRSS